MPSKKHTDDHHTAPANDWPLIEALLASPLVRTAYIFGPPGIGKTYCAYNLGRISLGVFPVTLTPETPASELIGHYIPHGNALRWHDGPFTRALRAGGRLVINEITHASSDVIAVLYPVLESAETAQLMLADGEIVRPAPGFHAVMTDNESPQSLPEALQDRFDCEIHVACPHPEALKAIDADLRQIALRTMMLGDERRVTMRRWLAICRLRSVFGLERACHAVLGSARGSQIYDAIRLAARGGSTESQAPDHGV
jgi:MoxR-like ATPase